VRRDPTCHGTVVRDRGYRGREAIGGEEVAVEEEAEEEEEEQEAGRL